MAVDRMMKGLAYKMMALQKHGANFTPAQMASARRVGSGVATEGDRQTVFAALGINRTGATQQRQAARLLVVRQRRRRMRALLDLAADDRALARAACAVLAAVRQADALAKGSCQHGFVGFHLKLPAALPERYVECHKSFSLRIQKVGNQCVPWIAATMRPR